MAKAELDLSDKHMESLRNFRDGRGISGRKYWLEVVELLNAGYLKRRKNEEGKKFTTLTKKGLAAVSGFPAADPTPATVTREDDGEG